MAVRLQMGMPWHEGELEMHRRLGGPDFDNPTTPMLSQRGAVMLQQAPLVAVGTLDLEDRPWVTLWGGQSGFCRALGGGVVGLKTLVDDEHDPVVKALCGPGDGRDADVQRNKGKMIGGLTLDLDRRNRVKLYGRMMAGGVAANDSALPGDIQLVLKIEQSLGTSSSHTVAQHRLMSTDENSQETVPNTSTAKRSTGV